VARWLITAGTRARAQALLSDLPPEVTDLVIMTLFKNGSSVCMGYIDDL
jgi:hypothetical protein